MGSSDIGDLLGNISDIVGGVGDVFSGSAGLTNAINGGAKG